MSDADEAMQLLDLRLAAAYDHVKRLARLLNHRRALGSIPHILAVDLTRHDLTAALRDAANAASDVGVAQLDQRWCGIVALLAHAGECVRGIETPPQAAHVSGLLERLRTRAVQLRHAAAGRPVSVRLH
jgi:hypothetical protein